MPDRHHFRFQVQRPNADRILEGANGGPLSDIGFFKMGKFNVGSHETTALNHRMSDAPAFEVWGRSGHGAAVQEIIRQTGAPTVWL